MTDFARYSRQVVLREVGVNGQQLIRDSSVLVIGLGGLGSAASLYLAGAGVGRLLIADRDRVEASNLQRQLLYRREDVGRPKTEAAHERLAALNPDVELELFEGRLEPARLAQMVNAADVVLDCTDNFPTRFAINAACVRARKPLVSGAAIRFEGQVAVFDPRRADGACYACVFPEEGAAGEICEEAGVLGPVVGTIGSLQALAALKLLLGRGEDVNRLRIWNALDMNWRTMTVAKDPGCKACGAQR
ncbi:MAG TPA: HesA/MoeB/ThiF family protein [Verrucomicrobiae bacterium]|nr:HesA/MoeB/ThiF family protein [Verrucomicrobiae bacterium]